MAFHWIMKAAEQGKAEAQYNVAQSYDNGDGVKQDKAMAFIYTYYIKY
jgi:uncharacterized protein